MGRRAAAGQSCGKRHSARSNNIKLLHVFDPLNQLADLVTLLPSRASGMTVLLYLRIVLGAPDRAGAIKFAPASGKFVNNGSSAKSPGCAPRQ
jgi:hypothetical protein